jgi:hypothetical protein
MLQEPIKNKQKKVALSHIVSLKAPEKETGEF